MCWLYSVPNLLVIQYLGTLYLGENKGIWRIKCIKLWMNQSCFSLGFLFQNSLWKFSTFLGYKGIYSRLWDGMWKVPFQQNRVHWWVTHDWDESRVLIASYQTTPNYTFCPVVIQLAWLFIFLHASHMRFILTSHHSRVSRESPSCCTLLIKSLHSLTYNPYIILT